MDFSEKLWRFVHLINTKSMSVVLNSTMYREISKMVTKNISIWIHTSYLPHLPYEENTFVGFKDIETAFDTLYEMYQKHGNETHEGLAFCHAYKVMREQLMNVDDICDQLLNVSFM